MLKKFKKYSIVTVFRATRCDEKLSKEKEKRLKQISKEIIKLYQEQKELFVKLVEGDQ